jgi:hypothetical protein
VAITVDMPDGKRQNFWIIGGRLIGGRDNVGQDTSRESREMANIDSRLKHMVRLAPASRFSIQRFFSVR